MTVFALSAIILIFCALSSKVMYKYGIPVLIAFLAVGMLMGSDGPGGIYFDDANLAKDIANAGLIFIIFFGGLGMQWNKARPIIAESLVLSTVGVCITAGLTGLFVHMAFGFSWLEGLLLGAVISSTDAASVFSILWTRKLNLKNHLSRLLEMESGSNDPFAYMLTITLVTILSGGQANIPGMLALQILFGVAVGVGAGFGGAWLINRIRLDIDGLYSILMIGIALFSFGGAEQIGGNGFLSVYITGLILGNSKLVHRNSLIRYFDGLAWLMQILLFITLGLLVFPSRLPAVAGAGLLTAVFMIIVARPLAVFAILAPFKRSIKEMLLVSWVGFRGAASIVFATYPITAGLPAAGRIFDIVFFVALVSVVVQGTLFIPIARKLGLVKESEAGLTALTDYTGDIHAEMLQIGIREGDGLAGRAIMELDLPGDILVMMIQRGNRIITPKGPTVLEAGDTVLLAGEKESLLRYRKNEVR